MIVDTSAVLAILFRESEADAFLAALAGAETRRISAVTRFEAAILLIARRGPAARHDLDQLLTDMRIAVEPFTEQHARLAADAFDRFGKGRHPAALNLGDCCSYALAQAMGEPLLFKGGDFSRTDIATA